MRILSTPTSLYRKQHKQEVKSGKTDLIMLWFKADSFNDPPLSVFTGSEFHYMTLISLAKARQAQSSQKAALTRAAFEL